MTLPRLLLGRQELSAVALVPQATIAYWAKEGVVRPEAGTGGKGHHLRFSRIEGALVSILGCLRNLGVATVALSELASDFHRAIDWIDTYRLDPEETNEVDRLVRDRVRIDPLATSAGWKRHLAQVLKDPLFDLSPSSIKLAQEVNVSEWIRNASFYSGLTTLGLERPTKSRRTLKLTRNAEGSWSIVTNGDPSDYFSVDLNRLGERLWALDIDRHASR